MHTLDDGVVCGCGLVGVIPESLDGLVSYKNALFVVFL